MPSTELLPGTHGDIGGSEVFQEPPAFEEEEDLVEQLNAGTKRELARGGTEVEGEVLGGVRGSVLAKRKEAEE